MTFDAHIVDAYIAGKEISESSNSSHWIYDAIEPGKNVFMIPDRNRITEVAHCLQQTMEVCRHFTFRNERLVHEVFANATKIKNQCEIIFVVGVPVMYDAMVREYEDVPYIIFNMMSFADYVARGHDLGDIVRNFLTHELIHLMIGAVYPAESLNYRTYFECVAFHEGFAHLLSYKENIGQYIMGPEYQARFEDARALLKAALNETDPARQAEYKTAANSGKYWDKFAAVASMCYLMKNISSLKCIYERGWQNYTDAVIAYIWE
ncbi:MAG: hypothetical protein FWC71_03950 [Defluviitaleaceae bacterium]|nr:hypothetical protein [Defluviitaleaceae bacterium]